ncbi:unnamed protein product [Protopolystoma xenopodis]|uniref:Uncharacterized protein n=1 Tax=Protopolystoma xenopodis TaxID=117903 RepID=A0A3S5A2X7_9PLAT|nr:unnamed protein product [Protopolystoma xenopodis]
MHGKCNFLQLFCPPHKTHNLRPATNTAMNVNITNITASINNTGIMATFPDPRLCILTRLFAQSSSKYSVMQSNRSPISF